MYINSAQPAVSTAAPRVYIYIYTNMHTYTRACICVCIHIKNIRM